LLSVSPLEPVASLPWPESVPPLIAPGLSTYIVAHTVLETFPEIKSASLNTSGFKG
jgi:hypothetical protein